MVDELANLHNGLQEKMNDPSKKGQSDYSLVTKYPLDDNIKKHRDQSL